MAKNTPDQEILNQIAGVLGRIAPAGAQEMVFRGKVYDDFSEGIPGWVDETGEEIPFGAGEPLPLAEIEEILDLAEGLLETPIFRESPFTHFEVRLNRVPEIRMRTADIPVEQSWDNLFMRPVGDLTKEEAKALHIPEKDWRKCVDNSK